VDGNVLSTNLSNGLSVEALGGESLNVKISEDGSIMINNAKVVIADIEASNGVIHVIDAVLSFVGGDNFANNNNDGTFAAVEETSGSRSTIEAFNLALVSAAFASIPFLV